MKTTQVDIRSLSPFGHDAGEAHIDLLQNNSTVLGRGALGADAYGRTRTMGARELVADNVDNESSLANFLDNAYALNPDELVRMPGNEGNDIDPDYINNHATVQRFFVDEIIDGSLYESSELFEQKLKAAHVMAASGDIYQRVGKGHNLKTAGEYRHGRYANSREGSAYAVAFIAGRYGDPYAQRFSDRRGVWKLELSGIDSRHSAVDQFEYDEQQIQDGSVMDQDGMYRFIYPASSAVPQYMEQITRLGQEIRQLLIKPEEPNKVIALVANQYQYGAVIRPFEQINNSLFMDLANVQLKLAGFSGISHGILDAAAQRMQPTTFAEFFTDCVLEASLPTSNDDDSHTFAIR